MWRQRSVVSAGTSFSQAQDASRRAIAEAHVNDLRHLRSLAAEAWFVLLSQRVVSVMSTLVVTGMVLAVLLSAGRAEGARQAVLGSIDDVGSRSIIVEGDAGSGLTTEALDRADRLVATEWVGAFGTSLDVSNLNIPGGTPVSARKVWTTDAAAMALPDATEDHLVYLSAAAAARLGFGQISGAVVDSQGSIYSVDGRYEAPNFLSFLGTFAAIPTAYSASEPSAISTLVVVAESPQEVDALAAALSQTLSVDDPSKVTISTNGRIAELRGLVDSQLGEFGRALVAGVFLISALLMAGILYSFVILRRKDFGRRRALGATRGTILGLIALQTAYAAVVGALLGTAASLIALRATGDEAPTLSFVLAVGVAALVVSVLASLVPGSVAARRDPLRELRVP